MAIKNNHVVMLDARDEDVELFQGVMQNIPMISDFVTLELSDDRFSLWEVTSRCWAVESNLILLKLNPVNRGEWDGSGDRYVESLQGS